MTVSPDLHRRYRLHGAQTRFGFAVRISFGSLWHRSQSEEPAVRQAVVLSRHARSASLIPSQRFGVEDCLAALRSRWNLHVASVRAGPGMPARTTWPRAGRSVVSVRSRHPFTRILYWATLALLIVAAVSVCARDYIDDHATERLLLAIHEWSGLTVLVVIALRLIWRMYAALWHHYMRRDDVLRPTQLFRRRRRRKKVARCVFPRHVLVESECLLCSRQRAGLTQPSDQHDRVPAKT